VLLGLGDNHGLSPNELITALRAKTKAAIIMTLGSEGCLVDDGASVVSIPAIKASKVVDTTGAGDSFTSALAVALAEGKDLHSAVRFATASGAHCVSIAGVIDSLPRRGDIERKLAE
jgi:ribokinase